MSTNVDAALKNILQWLEPEGRTVRTEKPFINGFVDGVAGISYHGTVDGFQGSEKVKSFEGVEYGEALHLLLNEGKLVDEKGGICFSLKRN
jgi:hypothetical protein